MRYVLGGEGDDAARLRTLIGFFAGNRFLRNDAIIGVSVEGEPRGWRSAPCPTGCRRRRWTSSRADLGRARAEARARYDRCVEVWTPLGVAEPNVHLNMLAVPFRFQGQGLGGAAGPGARPVAGAGGLARRHLTTEVESNVALYRHVGYEVVGRGTIAPGLETWGMYRRDDLSGAG